MGNPEQENGPDEETCLRFVCIHGHFYQPPRENPWLEQIEVQDSAAPFHDWNERICAECYGPNAHARIQNSEGRVERMINNYEWISFNVGPTLLVWLERAAPHLLRAIQDADRASVKRCRGHGNAIAQAYNHTILPLAGLRDKQIQVRWGIEAFHHYFQRPPEGMWLPEAAVDLETLEVLADHDIRFTVLSPDQAARFRRPGSPSWLEIGEQVLNTRVPYCCTLPSGREMNLFFYDGEVAQQVAFQRLLNSGEQFMQRLLSRFDPDETGPQIVHVATDGETFGHHHRFGEMALAYFIQQLRENGETRMINYGEYLSRFAPDREVQIVEKSSWSCAHGVERWRSDCGCRLGGADQHQRWRAPLREALDHLKEGLDRVFEEEGNKLFSDPWEVLFSYVQILLNRDEEGIHAFFQRVLGRDATEEECSTALKLLEMQRHAQLMFTSCAWFFDEISGIESLQVLKFAARAIQLAEHNFSARLEEGFLEILKEAPSNDPRFGDGKRLWEEEVRPEVIDLERVLAHFAILAVFRRDAASRESYAYSRINLDEEIHETGLVHLSLGRAEVISHITLQRSTKIYAVIQFGGLDVQFFWLPDPGEEAYQALKARWDTTYREASVGDLYQTLLRYFGQSTHTLDDLFLDEQRLIIDRTLQDRVNKYNVQFERFFQRDSVLIKRLARLKYPIPEPMRMAATAAADRRMRRLVNQVRDSESMQVLSEFYEEATQWGYRPPVERWERYFLLLLEKKMQALENDGEGPSLLQEAGYVLQIADIMEVPLNLWNIQNQFVEICRTRAADFESCRDEIRAFARQILLSPEALSSSMDTGDP